VKNAVRGNCEVLLIMLSTALSAGLATACGGAPDSHSLQDGVTNTVSQKSATGEPTAPAPGSACAVADEGCPCENEGAAMDCKGPKIHIGDYTSCLPGKRFCVDGQWSECFAKTLVPPPNSAHR
jgi:hypothetical protein